MCATCDQALKLPVESGLRLIEKAYARGQSSSCLDKTVGKLCGIDEDHQVDKAKDAAWERARR